MPGIFISYRRDDQAGFAGRLADALEATFGADNVFRDIEDIHPGEDFVVAIEKNLAAVDVMLALIGPAWLSLSRQGVRRLDEPDDFVRREIEAGLTAGKVVLPVLVGGAAMPAESELPSSIRTLARRQALVLTDAGWSADLARLIAVVATKVPVVRPTTGRPVAIWGGVALLAAALLAVGLNGFGTKQTGDAAQPVAVAPAQNVSGRWQATIKYDWGAEHLEKFELQVDKDKLHGTAGYLGVARMIEQGTVSGEQLGFVTHSQEVAGDGPAREVTHRYRGTLKAGELHLVLESGGGFSAHTPVSFVARRADGG
ncbi:MAG: hypothetical protein H6R14_2576 [Proteobacteria bacterium]|nr:hypothetical protein [Pseudomonadota bacterium]